MQHQQGAVQGDTKLGRVAACLGQQEAALQARHRRGCHASRFGVWTKFTALGELPHQRADRTPAAGVERPNELVQGSAPRAPATASRVGGP